MNCYGYFKVVISPSSKMYGELSLCLVNNPPLYSTVSPSSNFEKCAFFEATAINSTSPRSLFVIPIRRPTATFIFLFAICPVQLTYLPLYFSHAASFCASVKVLLAPNILSMSSKVSPISILWPLGNRLNVGILAYLLFGQRRWERILYLKDVAIFQLIQENPCYAGVELPV